jgi:UDP-N-acetylglucosamine 2-epimerase (non-hydrolysing)
MLKVLMFIGTRPEAIKLAPLALKLRAAKAVSVHVCLTGQHRELVNGMLEVFGVTADSNLEVMNTTGNLCETAAAVLTSTDRLMRELKPGLVIVQGDTTSAFAAAAAAAMHKITVAHVEAGLRTNDKHSPFPEELNRRWITVASDLHFAPTEWAASNLAAEGVEANVFITGNTVVDALQQACAILDSRPPAKPAAYTRPFVLVTTHRRENQGHQMRGMCGAFKEIVKKHDVELVLPVHANPRVSEVIREELSGKERIHLIKPLDYLSMVDHMRKAAVILTDSGGVQEEAPAFKKPVLVMRDTTERPEGIVAGTSELIGCEPEPIVERASELLTSAAQREKFEKAENPYGDGLASERVCSIIGRHFDVASLKNETPMFRREPITAKS